MRSRPRRFARARRSRLSLARGVVSTTVLLLLIADSLPVSGLLQRAGTLVVQAQLAPALLRMRETLTVGVGVAILVFPLIILITAAIGRGYCSSICPLGTLQDVVFALSRKFIKVRLHFRTPRSMLRAAILALVVTCWAAGSTIPLALLEPFSIVARVVSLTRGSPTSVRSLPVPGGNSPELFTAAAAPVAAAVLSMAVLVSVLFVAAAKGRLFCNTLCPVGALLSLPGSYSILRIRMARERCTACGLCERVCPARCIDVKTAHIYAGSCTLCFSCLAACPTGALRYGASEEAS